VLAGDQGVFSPANERLAQRLGVKQIAIPQPGPKTAQRRAHEKQAWFKQGQRFRNGIEGRISVVRRTVQLARCPYQGLEGFEQWIGWGSLSPTWSCWRATATNAVAVTGIEKIAFPDKN
jgi:IS5 family transposase